MSGAVRKGTNSGPRPLVAWDYLLAFLALVFIVESPFTPNELGPSLAIGVLVGAWVLWYRSTRVERDLARAAAPSFRERMSDVDPASVVALLLFAWLCAPTLQWMYQRWTSGLWQNQHSLLFACLIVALTRSILKRTHSKIDPSAWGLLPLTLGLAMIALDTQVRTNYLGSIGFVVCLPGLSLLLLGRTRARALLGPLVLCVFLIPVPYTLTKHLFLREITATGAAHLLSAAGLQTYRDASFISIPDATFVVADACSGIATMTAGTGIALILSTQVDSVKRRIAIWLALVPLVLGANILRAAALVLLTRVLGMDVLDTVIHQASGLAIFLIMLVGLYLVADRPQLMKAFE